MTSRKDGLRSGSLGKGTHSYGQDSSASEGRYSLVRMCNGRWYVFDADGRDTGEDFKTLRDARAWARENPQTAVMHAAAGHESR